MDFCSSVFLKTSQWKLRKYEVIEIKRVLSLVLGRVLNNFTDRTSCTITDREDQLA